MLNNVACIEDCQSFAIGREKLNALSTGQRILLFGRSEISVRMWLSEGHRFGNLLRLGIIAPALLILSKANHVNWSIWEHFMRRTFLVLFILPLFLLACGEEEPLPTVVSPIGQTDTELAPPVVSDDPIVLPTETAVPVTPTPEAPLAARVNGEPLLLATFEAELARYQQAQVELGNQADGEDYSSVVLDTLIEQVLIRQAAAAQGVVVTDEMIDQEMAELQAVAGSAEANRYSREEFRTAVADGLIHEQIATIVTADVPFAVEQVHARYIQVDDLNLANTLLAQIQNGDDFATLAQLHSLDRITGENVHLFRFRIGS